MPKDVLIRFTFTAPPLRGADLAPARADREGKGVAVLESARQGSKVIWHNKREFVAVYCFSGHRDPSARARRVSDSAPPR